MLIFAKNPVEKSRQLFIEAKACYRYLYKVVAQITSFHVSGQRTLNSIPTRNHEPNKKNDGFGNRGSVIRIFD